MDFLYHHQGDVLLGTTGGVGGTGKLITKCGYLATGGCGGTCAALSASVVL